MAAGRCLEFSSEELVIQTGPLRVQVVCMENFVFGMFGEQSNLQGQQR